MCLGDAGGFSEDLLESLTFSLLADFIIFFCVSFSDSCPASRLRFFASVASSDSGCAVEQTSFTLPEAIEDFVAFAL